MPEQSKVDRSDPRLLCPRDGRIMEKVTVAGVIVDRCHLCGSMWFDAAELRKVLANKSAVAELDTGGDSTGARGFAVGLTVCPRDGSPLAVVPDDAQSHIKVDLCRTCRGVLLDAGELKDLSEITLRERLRALVK